MAGLGFSGAFGAAGAADALQQLIAQRKAEAMAQLQMQMQLRQQADAEAAQKFQQSRQTSLDERQTGLDARSAAIENLKLLEGQPAADQPGQQMNIPMPDVTGMNPSAIPFKLASPVEIPGVAGLPSLKVRPRSAEELRQAKDSAERITLSRGEKVVSGTGETVATGEPFVTPPDFQSKEGLIGPKGGPVSYDPHTDTYRENGVQVPQSQVRRAPPQRDPGAQQGRDDARMDRSYQFNSAKLSALRKPLADAADRLDRIDLSVAQRSPQADALIAPELLTAMAGGSGSGLRMNEAEISRIVGGRSNWESLKAALNKWKGPGDALSVTPAQRQQISALLAERGKQVRSKLQLLDQADEALINATDVNGHRLVTSQAQQALSRPATATEDTSGEAPKKKVSAAEWLKGKGGG